MKRAKTKKLFSTFRSDCDKKRKSIAKMRKQFPCYTLQQIGDEFGIGRERVRQVLNLESVETRSLQRLTTGKKCQRCGDIISERQRKDYCSKCRYELHHVQIVCDQCGKLFWRKASLVLVYPNRKMEHNHFFCDRVCFGKWTGKKNGFGKNPNNINHSLSRNIIFHNLFVDNHQLINVVDAYKFDWEEIFRLLLPGVVLCFAGEENRQKIRYRLQLASRYHGKHLITTIMDDRLYAREK